MLAARAFELAWALPPSGTEAVKRALVIEDNRLIAMMIRDELVECGYESVEIATSQGTGYWAGKGALSRPHHRR